jgi:hypothetical protein
MLSLFRTSGKNSCVRFLTALLILALTGAWGAAGQGPANLDFEDGELGKIPIAWTLPASSAKIGFTAAISEDDPRSGKRCVLVSRPLKGKDPGLYSLGDQGKLTQTFAAAGFRGKRVRFRVAARVEPAGFLSWGQFLVRISPKTGLPAFHDDMADRPILHKQWRDYEILAEVAQDADRIDLELILGGTARRGLTRSGWR